MRFGKKVDADERARRGETSYGHNLRKGTVRLHSHAIAFGKLPFVYMLTH